MAILIITIKETCIRWDVKIPITDSSWHGTQCSFWKSILNHFWPRLHSSPFCDNVAQDRHGPRQVQPYLTPSRLLIIAVSLENPGNWRCSGEEKKGRGKNSTCPLAAPHQYIHIHPFRVHMRQNFKIITPVFGSLPLLNISNLDQVS